MNLVKGLVNVIEDRQGQDIAVCDMREVSPFMDYMIMTHVSNPRLLGALAQYITDYLDEKQVSYAPIEGDKSSSKWLLIDAKEVIVHLFLEDERYTYNLEKLWADCLISLEEIDESSY